MSLIAVLIPLLFMGDIVGRLFREFAVTLAVTILISAVVSLTLTPMMSARLLTHTPDRRPWPVLPVVRACVRPDHPRLWPHARRRSSGIRRRCWSASLATLALTALLFVIVPKGFFPVQDTGVIQAVSVAAESVSFPEMVKLQQQAVGIITRDPAVEHLSSFVGIDQTNTTLNNGRLLINLKPLEQRRANATEIIRRLQPALTAHCGTGVYMQPVQDITVDDRVSRTQFQYTLEDPNVDELHEWAPRMLAKLQQLPDIRDAASDQQELGLRAQLVIDRDTASRLGITPAFIDQTLYDSYGQRQISTMFTQLNQYHVILEVEPQFREHPVDLRDLFIRSGVATAPSPSTNTGVVAGGLAGGTSGRSPVGTPATSSSPQRNGDGERHHPVWRRPRRVLDQLSQRQPGAAERARPRRANDGPDHDQSPGPVSSRDAVVQSGARGVAGCGGRRRVQGEGRIVHAGQHSGGVSGRRRGIRELAGATSRC